MALRRLRRWVRLVIAALAGHGVFDLKHFRMLTNPNLPIWLAMLWIGFDILKSATGKWWATAALANARLPGLRLPQAQAS
jgi:hypothetical protein